MFASVTLLSHIVEETEQACNTGSKQGTRITEVHIRPRISYNCASNLGLTFKNPFPSEMDLEVPNYLKYFLKQTTSLSTATQPLREAHTEAANKLLQNNMD